MFKQFQIIMNINILILSYPTVHEKMNNKTYKNLKKIKLQLIFFDIRLIRLISNFIYNYKIIFKAIEVKNK